MKRTSFVFQTILSFTVGVLGAWIYTAYLYEPSQVVSLPTYTLQDSKPSQAQFSSVSSLANMGTIQFAEASSLSTPSVVYIKTATAQETGYSWFDLLFYGGSPTQVVVSSGSGVIYSQDGYIITNNHVIENADQIEVVHAKKTYKARLIGTDVSSDIAVLKIDAKGLPAIKIGSSKALAVGDWVLAVGNPFNLESTVTAGIVSAKGRSINILKGRFPLESFIQTDAAINPGNSGGALVNIAGELVGINTAILSQTGSYAGYGFAVPIDMVKKIADDIIAYGEVQRAFTGLEVEDISSEVAAKYSLDNLEGVVVKSTLRDAPAAKVGITRGDVILRINSDPIQSKSAFDEAIAAFRPGDKIKVWFRRDGKIVETSLTLTNKEGTTDILKKETVFYENLGVELEAVPKIERDRLNVDAGVRVTKVFRNGLFSRLDISEGFIIVSINNKKIKSPDEVPYILERVRGRVIIDGITANGQRGYYSYIF